jgi:hypothetical protein
VHLGQVDPVGGADVEAPEVKVESAIFPPQMPTLAQMVATARRAVRVPMVSSSHNKDATHTRPLKGAIPASLDISQRTSIRGHYPGNAGPKPLIQLFTQRKTNVPNLTLGVVLVTRDYISQ